jgi:hypothetical protein
MKEQLKGTREVMDGLQSLEPKLQANILRNFSKNALKNKAINPLRGVALSRRGERSFKIDNVRGSKTTVAVGPSRSGWVERFLQGGTINRETKKGWKRGSIRGNATLKSAVEYVIDPVIKFFNDEMGTEIAKTLQRRVKSVRNRINKIIK